MRKILLPLLLLFLIPDTSDAQLFITGRLSRVSASETFDALDPFDIRSTTTRSEEATDLLLFSQSAKVGGASASQESNVNAALFGIESSVDAAMAGTEFGSTSASSLFSVEFSVFGSAEYNLTGVLTEIDTLESADFGNGGGSSVSLTGNGVDLLIESDFANTVNIDQSGILGTGSYVFEVRSSGSGSVIEPSASTGVDVSLEIVSAVPEPSSILILAPAAALLLGRRRRSISCV